VMNVVFGWSASVGGYLVGTRLGIHEAQELALDSEVNDPIDLGKREKILQTCLVHACVVHTHRTFPTLLRHQNWIGYPVRVLDLLDKASG
jgi:hypothetical protein